MIIFRNMSEFFYKLSLSKWQLKVLFALATFGIVVGVILYTQWLVYELIDREQKTIKFYSEIYSHYLTENSTMNYEEFFFFVDNIKSAISFPIIITDENDEPIYDFAAYTHNIDLDTSKTIKEQREYLKKYINEMRAQYPPINVVDQNGKVIQKFYYTNSSLINRLRFFPVAEILILALFVIIGYITFSYIRRNEETKVWIGMAKEAAHQLGTPLSSLLAWLEILKINKEAPESIESTIAEMENDINRLNTIATRFSKIGSKPEKKREDLYAVIETICQYFEKRIPHLGRQIEIIRHLDPEVYAEINIEIFQWVIENLLKNATEAIETKRGKITVTLDSSPKNRIHIFIADTGKGISAKQKRQIFYPGYTTKKRGWGLGLSLSRRIIEDYHNGRIYVKETSPGKGSTFVIELRKPKRS